MLLSSMGRWVLHTLPLRQTPPARRAVMQRRKARCMAPLTPRLSCKARSKDKPLESTTQCLMPLLLSFTLLLVLASMPPLTLVSTPPLLLFLVSVTLYTNLTNALRPIGLKFIHLLLPLIIQSHHHYYNLLFTTIPFLSHPENPRTRPCPFPP